MCVLCHCIERRNINCTDVMICRCCSHFVNAYFRCAYFLVFSFVWMWKMILIHFSNSSGNEIWMVINNMKRSSSAFDDKLWWNFSRFDFDFAWPLRKIATTKRHIIQGIELSEMMKMSNCTWLMNELKLKEKSQEFTVNVNILLCEFYALCFVCKTFHIISHSVPE